MYRHQTEHPEDSSRATALSATQRPGKKMTPLYFEDNRKDIPIQKNFQRGTPPGSGIDDLDSHHIQKSGDPNPKDHGASSSLILEDSVSDLSAGQETKGKFLKRLHQAIYSVGTEAYRGSNLTVENCPYILYLFNLYRNKESQFIEDAAKKYAGVTAVSSVDALIGLICRRARKGFEKQVRTGEITELPQDIPLSVGDGKIPEPEQIVQRKTLKSAPPFHQKQTSLQRQLPRAQTGAIQRGCLFNRGGGGGGVATITVRDGDTPNWQHIPAGNNTILRTSAMGDCWALIVVTAAGGRILAHVPGGDGGQLNSGGIGAINGIIGGGGGVVTIVRGLANQANSPYMNTLLYTSLAGLALPAGPGQTRAGFFAHASVDAAGTVNTW